MQEQEVLDILYDRLEEYLISYGISIENKFECLSQHHNDTDPSCNMVPGNSQLAHCFGCLPGDEIVRCEDGIRYIKDVKINDRVYDIKGNLERVIDNETHKADYQICEIKLRKFKTINQFTENHRMLVVSENLVDQMPYMVYAKNIGKPTFNSQLYNTKRSKKYKNHLKIQEKMLGDISVGDYMVFPTNVYTVKDDYIPTQNIIRPYRSGPKNKRIKKIPLTEEVLYMMGMFVAEGNIYRGGINFSLHRKEIDYAKKIKTGIEQITSDHSVVIDKHKNRKKSLSIRCSSTDLEVIFEHHFGKGCDNKRIPKFILHLPENLKRSFIRGLFDGDATKDDYLTLTSKEVILELKHILFSLGITFSYTEKDKNKQKDGKWRKPTYSININKLQHRDFFYDVINGQKYAFLKIESIKKTGRYPQVYDITVENTHTFLTEKYAVCNCNKSFNIFHAAHELEGLPNKGPDFWKLTVPTLCEKFDIDYKPKELTEEDKERFKMLAAYRDASDIICTYPDENDGSDNPIYEYLANRKWSVKTARELSIGAIVSYDTFLSKMRDKGWSDNNYLYGIGLGDKVLLNRDNLIFVVKDENGRPRGFAARNMKWTPDGENGEKYRNTKTTDIYHKSELMYNFHMAKQHMKKDTPLWIVEGYADVPTLWEAGIKNVAGVGGTAFGDAHIELLTRTDTYKIYFMYDNDNYDGKKKGGQESLKSIIEKYFQSSSIFHVRIKQLPNNTDPDSFIKDKGIKEFRNLPLVTPFEWILNKHTYTEDPYELAQKYIPHIAQVQSATERERMIEILSVVSGIGRGAIRTDVKSELKKHDRDKALARKKWAEETQYKLNSVKMGHASPEDVLVEAQSKWEDQIRNFTDLRDEDEKYKSRLKGARRLFMMQSVPPFNMGSFQQWQSLSETIRREGAFIGLAAIPNVGKSSLARHLSWEILNNNEDSMVIYFSLDDSFTQLLQGYLSIEAQLRINDIKDADVEIVNNPEKMKKWHKAWGKIDKFKDRLIIKDITDGCTLEYIENTIKYYKSIHSDKHIMVIIDSFNKIRSYEGSDKEAAATMKSGRLKGMATTYNVPILAILELRKTENFKTRPTIMDIKNSRAMEYDCNMILLMHQQLHIDDESLMYHLAQTEKGNIKMPICEVNFAKNKMSDFKGRIYFKFRVDQSRFEEVPSFEVDKLLEKERKRKYGN